MIRRTLVIALLLALLAPAAAVAQGGGPFSPLPPAQPTAEPTPEPSNDSLTSDLGGRNTLYLIGAALLVAFIGIGVFISRDARRSLPADHRPDSHRLRDQGPHQHKRQAKAKARQRARAQKAARRRNR
jgi:hypothetical protein